MPRRCLLYSIVVLSAGFACAAADRQTVLFATTRNGWIDAIDPDSLQTLGRLSIGVPVEGVTAMPDGRTHLRVRS